MRRVLQSLLLRKCQPNSVTSRAQYWWGHYTLDDREAERKALADKQLIRWTDPESDIEVKKAKYLYAPIRIKQEAMLVKPKYTLGNFSINDYFATVRQPILPYFSNYAYYVEKRRCKEYQVLLEAQLFVRERLTTLGPDLAAAHFLCHRNCRVRFKGHIEWTAVDAKGRLNIPTSYERGWYIEAIDAAESLLIYEGIQNLRNLIFVKYLDVSGCPLFDEWCLDRISGEYQDSLEYLNLSSCYALNWNGLEVLWRFKNLKVLVLEDMDHVRDLPLLCLMLLDINPDLEIRGVDYIDRKLLEGTEHEHLLEEVDNLLLQDGTK